MNGSSHCVWNVVKFEIEKDFLAIGNQVTHDAGTGGSKEFLAYLIEADGIAEGLHQRPRLIFMGHVQRDYQAVSTIIHETRITHFGSVVICDSAFAKGRRCGSHCFQSCNKKPQGTVPRGDIEID
jgi:hypothetical protein